MTPLKRKPLVTLLTAAAVSGALGLAGAPLAMADDDSQPPNDGGYGNAISGGPETYGKIAQYPVVDSPKLSFNPPTDRPRPQATPSDDSDDQSGDSDDNDNNDDDN
jgi:hypothetical protein